MSGRNVSVMGVGSLAGGSYGKVRILGTGNAVGEINARKVSIAGTLTTGDSLKADKLTVMGTADFADVNADKANILGTAEFNGFANVKTLKIKGAGNFKNGVKSDRIHVRGIMTASHEIETEQFTARGMIHLELLNANDIRLVLNDKCSIGEIGASTIEVFDVRNKWSILDMINLIFYKAEKRELKVELIEADTIYLENTNAAMIRGRDVTIGQGCRIQSIEFTNSLKVDNRSVVDSSNKV